VTNVITAVEVTEVTERNVGDAPMLTPLLASTVKAGFDYARSARTRRKLS